MKAKKLAELLLKHPDTDVVIDQVQFYSGGYQSIYHTSIKDEIEFNEKENKFIVSGYYDSHWAS